MRQAPVQHSGVPENPSGTVLGWTVHFLTSITDDALDQRGRQTSCRLGLTVAGMPAAEWSSGTSLVTTAEG